MCLYTCASGWCVRLQKVCAVIVWIYKLSVHKEQSVFFHAAIKGCMYLTVTETDNTIRKVDIDRTCLQRLNLSVHLCVWGPTTQRRNWYDSSRSSSFLNISWRHLIDKCRLEDLRSFTVYIYLSIVNHRFNPDQGPGRVLGPLPAGVYTHIHSHIQT